MSAIIIAGGASRCLGEEKGLVRLGDRPLVLHVLDRLENVADEVVVVVKTRAQLKRFAEVIDGRARIMLDEVDALTPLAGAATGFGAVRNEYALLLPCDTPFLDPGILGFLLEVCDGKSAAIPRWPSGNVEPLHASYRAQTAAEAARRALENAKLNMCALIENMRCTRYISTMVLLQFDPKLATFFRINSPNDLKQAEALIKHQAY